MTKPALAAAATFLVVLTFLALQMRAGEDPAIGAGPQTKAQAPKQVVVRRVIVRRIVEEDAGGGSAAPATNSAPAPAPAVPAPAPAPVVTRAS